MKYKTILPLLLTAAISVSAAAPVSAMQMPEMQDYAKTNTAAYTTQLPEVSVLNQLNAGSDTSATETIAVQNADVTDMEDSQKATDYSTEKEAQESSDATGTNASVSDQISVDESADT